MTMPKFKPTKWKLDYCLKCKKILGNYAWTWTCKENHKVVERDNVPFFIEEMQITSFGKWSCIKSTKPKESYTISRTKMGAIVLKCGVEPGGFIRNQWWMWTKVGGSTTLMWVQPDE